MDCTGCYHAFGDTPNPHMEECRICLRNPKFPTMRQTEEKILLDGIELKIPQDMYISRDRKNFEEKKFMKKLAEMMLTLGRREEKPKDPITNPYPYVRPGPSWEWYWEYVRQHQWTIR